MKILKIMKLKKIVINYTIKVLLLFIFSFIYFSLNFPNIYKPKLKRYCKRFINEIQKSFNENNKVNILFNRCLINYVNIKCYVIFCII